MYLAIVGLWGGSISAYNGNPLDLFPNLTYFMAFTLTNAWDVDVQLGVDVQSSVDVQCGVSMYKVVF
jgi:hypothetical protein